MVEWNLFRVHIITEKFASRSELLENSMPHFYVVWLIFLLLSFFCLVLFSLQISQFFMSSFFFIFGHWEVHDTHLDCLNSFRYSNKFFLLKPLCQITMFPFRPIMQCRFVNMLRCFPCKTNWNAGRIINKSNFFISIFNRIQQ